jgi:citrate lyase beta subunit
VGVVNRLDVLRSLLFVPGADEHKLTKALSLGADAVIADFEDGVALEQKDKARQITAEILEKSNSASARLIRVNAPDTPFFLDDMKTVARLAIDALVLPKATPDAVLALGDDGPPVIAIIETARGIQLAAQIASSRRVIALALGAADLGRELGLESRRDGLELLYARSKVVVDSAAAGIRPPIDVAYLNVRDLSGLEEGCILARTIGFRGKLCIHPGQVPIVNKLFTPTVDEVRWAKRVVEAHARATEEHQAVFAVDGEMIDKPVVERAWRVLAEAERNSS